MIPVYRPYLTKETTKYAHDAIDSTWISSKGKYLDLVESKLREMLNVPYVLLTNNGTTATHLVSYALEKYMVDNYNQEVTELIVPNNVYVAAWNAFLYNSKFKLKPIDANIDTWNMDLAKVNRMIYGTEPLEYDKKKALLAVHNLGNIINVPDLQKKYRNLTIVEDCCEGIFGIYNNQQAGTASLASSFSFYGNKTITSGEGGAVVTSNKELYDYMYQLSWQGQSSTKFVHDIMGYNYRMTNIAASLLYGQLMAYHEIIDKKLDVFTRYDSAFAQMPEIVLQVSEEGTIPANWMYGIRVETKHSDYENAVKFFTSRNIEIRPMFYPMSAHEYLYHVANKADEENASFLNKQCIILPSYPNLSKAEQDYVIEKVKEYVYVL